MQRLKNKNFTQGNKKKKQKKKKNNSSNKITPFRVIASNPGKINPTIQQKIKKLNLVSRKRKSVSSKRPSSEAPLFNEKKNMYILFGDPFIIEKQLYHS
jgi:hypothetical protein